MVRALQSLYLAASTDLDTLAAFAGLCTIYAAKAERRLLARLRGRRRPVHEAGPILATAREAAAVLGPSFTARKLYRLTPTLPAGCAIRKGGRLYYHLPTLKQWAAQQ